jgi:hypothetical protein
MIAVGLLLWVAACVLTGASVLLIRTAQGTYRGPGAHQMRMLIWPPRPKDDDQ